MYLPLYQGRMIPQFDHRANSVRSQPGEHSHNPYRKRRGDDRSSTPTQRFLPQTQYWVPAEDVEDDSVPAAQLHALGFGTSPDQRTRER